MSEFEFPPSIGDPEPRAPGIARPSAGAFVLLRATLAGDPDAVPAFLALNDPADVVAELAALAARLGILATGGVDQLDEFALEALAALEFGGH